MKHSFVRFLFVKNRANLFVIILILIVLVSVLNLLPNNLNAWYTNFLDPIISLSTVSIAVVIWYFQQKNYWNESLPKRITVHFRYKGEVVMSCYEAYLSGASDARQMGQQIGRQMAKGNLDFFPYISSNQPSICKSPFETYKGKSIDIMLYEITFYLSADDFPNNQNLKGKYMIWIDNNPETDENRELFIDHRPEKPFSVEQVKTEFSINEK